MAFEWIAWAVKRKTGKPAAKAVLIALCNYANDQGFCYPSVQTISEITEQSDKTIRLSLNYLIEIGLIERLCRKRRKDGTLSVYEYRLLSSGQNDQWSNLPVVKMTAGDKGDISAEIHSDNRLGGHVAKIPPAVKSTAQNQSEESKPVSKKKNKQKKKFEKPADVSDQVWEDFVEHRRAKNALITATVLSRIRGEADKAEWSMDDALAEMCARNWQGFNAEWITKKGNQHANTSQFNTAKSPRSEGIQRAKQKALEGRGLG